MSKKHIIIIISILINMVSPLRADSAIEISVLPIVSDETDNTLIEPLFNALNSYIDTNNFFKLKKNIESNRGLIPAEKKDYANLSDPDNCLRIAHNLGCNYLLFVKIERIDNSFLIRVSLFSAKDKSFIYTTEDDFLLPLKEIDAAGTIINRIMMFLDGTLPVISEIKAAKGGPKESIAVSWKCSVQKARFSIFRSLSGHGLFENIGEAESTGFIDDNVEPGLKYYYRIQPVVNDITGDKSKIEFGYCKMPAVKGEDPDKLIGLKRKNRPAVTDPGKRKIEARELKIIEPYYINLIKLGMILSIGTSYIQSGKVLIIRQFKDYIIDGNRIRFIDPDRCIASFFSRRLLGLLNKCLKQSPALLVKRFGKGRDAGEYLGEGWSNHPRGFAVTTGKNAVFNIPVKNVKSDLIIRMRLKSFKTKGKPDKQDVDIYINNGKFTSWELSKGGYYYLTIPLACFTDESLRIEFKLPDANPLSGLKPDKDRRRLAIRVSSVAIYNKPGIKSLFKRLVDNALLYCIYTDEKETVLKNGRTKFLPSYNAIGLSTEYFRDYKKWRSHTLMFGSSDKRLKKLVDKAQSQ